MALLCTLHHLAHQIPVASKPSKPHRHAGSRMLLVCVCLGAPISAPSAPDRKRSSALLTIAGASDFGMQLFPEAWDKPPHCLNQEGGGGRGDNTNSIDSKRKLKRKEQQTREKK